MKPVKSLKLIIVSVLMSSFTLSIYGQNETDSSTGINEINTSSNTIKKKKKKAWELGFGGSITQMNRVYKTNIQTTPKGGYVLDLDFKHALWGGEIFIARELNKHLYLDVVAGMGGANVYTMDNDKEKRYYYTGGLGLQWKLAPLFKSKYIDPYFRIGAQYTHRDFLVDYDGIQNINNNEVKWSMTNKMKKEGHDINNLFSIVGGFGINFWFNDCVAVGGTVNYMYRPGFISKQKHVADAFQSSLRLIFRFGGESKHEEPQVVHVPVQEHIYVDKIVEVPVERLVPVESEKVVFAMLQNVFFKFGTDEVTDESLPILDEVAQHLKTLENRHFLVVGYTDSKGPELFNLNLSRKRAASIVRELENRGVPNTTLKSRGVGMKVAIVGPKESEKLREGDRRVTIEEIFIPEYWNYIPKHD